MTGTGLRLELRCCWRVVCTGVDSVEKVRREVAGVRRMGADARVLQLDLSLSCAFATQAASYQELVWDSVLHILPRWCVPIPSPRTAR